MGNYDSLQFGSSQFLIIKYKFLLLLSQVFVTKVNQTFEANVKKLLTQNEKST